MNDNELIMHAYEEERRNIASLVKLYVDNAQYNAKLQLLDEQELDRKDAEQKLAAELDGEAYADVHKTMVKLSMRMMLHNENQRRRRDIQIGRAKHKRLLYGCLDTMYKREKKLETIVKAQGKDVGVFNAQIPDTIG